MLCSSPQVSSGDTSNYLEYFLLILYSSCAVSHDMDILQFIQSLSHLLLPIFEKIIPQKTWKHIF